MLNIVVPMAGRGSRFADQGYLSPKPLIEIHGVPMIRWVIDNLKPKTPHRFIFICQAHHIKEYSLEYYLATWTLGAAKIIPVDFVTEGAACTVLLARDLIENSDPLMIANSDQWVDFQIDTYLSSMESRELDGTMLTMTAEDPKWSFVRAGIDGLVEEVAEKRVISKEATVGIYNFRRGEDFVRGADQMIASDLRVNGEFYVAPVYNQLVKIGKKIGYFNVGSELEGMYGLGTPEDLDKFLITPISKQIANRLGR